MPVIPVDIAIVDPIPSTAITLSVNPEYLKEGQSAAQVVLTATRDGNMGDHKVDLELDESSTATADDYTLWSLTLHELHIKPGRTSASVPLVFTVHDDGEDEENETIVISGSTEDNLSVSDAVITIGEPEDITLSVSPDSIAESDAATEVTVTATMGAARPADTVVNITLGGTADDPADYTATALGSITIPANQTSGSGKLTITPVNDSLAEGSETITVSGASGSRQVSPADITITDGETITVNISGPSTVDEGDTATYTVSLSPAGVTPTADLTVNYATANGTATAGSDYTANSGTLTFTQTAAGSQTFTVSTMEDTQDESDETFTVSISSPAGGGGAAPALGTSSVTTTITDDDNAPTGITLSASPSTLGEDDSATSITVTATLNGGTTRAEATVVNLSRGGTATAGTGKDYTATALASITIPPNTASGTGTLKVTPIDDSIVEGDETIVLSGTTTVNLTVSDATITLTDDNKTTTTPDDDKDTAELSISGPASKVSEGNNATFTVTLSKAVSKQVQVAWSAPASGDDAAAADLGSTSTSGSVIFAAGSSAGAEQEITIATIDDALSEGDESFTVTLGTITTYLSGQVSLKSGASRDTATIAASDPITVNITGPSSVDEGEATTDYTVSLSPSGVKPTADLTLSYATADGTASAGKDYTAIVATTLTFTETAAGSQTFTVQTTEDTSDEPDETFTVSISSPSGGGGAAPTLGTASVTTTINDDDDAPTGITLSASPDTLGEDDSATSVTVKATLNGSTLPSDTVVTIGTLSGSATKGTDYAATALASITIPANRTSGSGTLTITPTDDLVVEGDETIIIPGTTTVAELSVTSASITLTDDDKGTTPTDDKDSAELSISGPSGSVSEGGDASFTVTLSQAVATQVQVAWSAPLGTDAAEGADLGTTSGTVTFAANSAAGATQSITITATDDALSEIAESFTVTLGTVTSTLSGQISLKNEAKSATATIAESDPITIAISGPSSVDEGDATSNYTVSLSPSGVKPTADLTVSYATSDGTATAGSDYTAKSGTLTFTNAAAGPQTFTVQTTEDSY